jgi:hypothetical protein
MKLEIEIDGGELMASVFDNLWRSSSPWLVEYAYGEDKNKLVPVTYDNPNYDPKTGEPETLTKGVGQAQLIEAYGKLLKDGKFHCGEPVPCNLDHWDTCVADYVLQYALFGKLVFG